MAYDLQSIRRNDAGKRMPIIVAYGVEGVGKSSFAASSPSPIFIPTEDGLGTIDCNAFPLIRTFDEMIEALSALYMEEHDFRTVVVDSIDWLEPLIWKKVSADHGVNAIEDIGFGKGYTHAITYWRMYLDGLNALRNEKNMIVIQIAHSMVKRFDNPETDAYDRYQIKLHEKASSLVREHADIVGFCNYHTSVLKEDAGFGKKSKRGVTSGQRLIHLVEKPAFQAKNRYAMPEQTILDWNMFAQHLPQLAPAATTTEAA